MCIGCFQGIVKNEMEIFHPLGSHGHDGTGAGLPAGGTCAPSAVWWSQTVSAGMGLGLCGYLKE